MLKKWTKRQAQHRLRGWTRRLACASLAIVFIASAFVGSASYLWCVPMARAMSTCCCHEAMTRHAAAADDSAAAVSAPCCETRHFEKLATADAVRTEAAHVPGPTYVTMLPALSWTVDVPAALDLLTSYPARAGPAPPKIPQYIRLRSLLI